MTVKVGRTQDVQPCLALRHAVFVLEQGVTLAEEQDGLDAQAHHILAEIDGTPMGTARMLIKGDTGKIGRVCVLQEARGTGLGAAIMEACLTYLQQMPGVSRAQLGAQTHALEFYERLGFEAYGPVYDDAGLPHRDMERVL